MLELILDQRFTWNGLPADKSPYGNHGQGIDTGGGADGVEPGSGFITFPTPSSRIRVPIGKAWMPLTALKIELVARIDPQAKMMSSIVDGHNSFSFGILEGALEARFKNGSGTNNYIRSDTSFAPDRQYHPVIAGRWMRLGFYHDGISRMQLFLDGELVGDAKVDGAIRPVMSGGIAIGNDWSNDDKAFPGEIDEIKIWRLDPSTMRREFLGRPYTRKTARCWERLARRIRDWTAQYPEQARALSLQSGEIRRRKLQAFVDLPRDLQAKLRAINDDIIRLWVAGDLGTPDMAAALCAWVALLRDAGIDPENDPDMAALVSTVQSLNLADPQDILKCDEQWRAFLDLWRQALDECGDLAGVAL